MFGRMSGQQLAAWGYGFFWIALLVETVNAFVSAQSTSPLASPAFWVGTTLGIVCAATGIRMLTLIRHRPW